MHLLVAALHRRFRWPLLLPASLLSSLHYNPMLLAAPNRLPLRMRVLLKILPRIPLTAPAHFHQMMPVIQVCTGHIDCCS